MTFETAFALYILNKGLLETSKAIFDAAPEISSMSPWDLLSPSERIYRNALGHFRDMESKTRYTKTEAAIAKVAETKDCSHIRYYETYVKYAKKSELEYTKAKAVADMPRPKSSASRTKRKSMPNAPPTTKLLRIPMPKPMLMLKPR